MNKKIREMSLEMEKLACDNPYEHEDLINLILDRLDSIKSNNLSAETFKTFNKSVVAKYLEKLPMLKEMIFYDARKLNINDKETFLMEYLHYPYYFAINDKDADYYIDKYLSRPLSLKASYSFEKHYIHFINGPSPHTVHQIYFENDFLEIYGYDFPFVEYFENKELMCCDCGDTIFYKTNKCRCQKKVMDEHLLISKNIGLWCLFYLREITDGKPIEKENIDSIKSQLITKIKNTAFPIISDFAENKPKYYKNTAGEIRCDDIEFSKVIDFYIKQHNERRAPRRLSFIRVLNLFGYYSYQIDLNKDISFIYGTNGLGKTTVLRLLEILFVRGDKAETLDNINFLFKMPFKTFEVEFSDGLIIKIYKKREKSIGKEKAIFSSYISGTSDLKFCIEICNDDSDVTLFKFSSYYDYIDEVLYKINNENMFLSIKTNRFNGLDPLEKDLMYNQIIHQKMSKDITESIGIYNNKIKELQRIIKEIKKDRIPSFAKDFQIKVDNIVDELVSETKFINSFDNDDKTIEKVITKKFVSNLLMNYSHPSSDHKLELLEKILIQPKCQKEMDFLLKYHTNELKSFDKLINLSRKFQFFSILYESIYYTRDPAIKKIIIDNDKLKIKVNTTLQNDFSKTLNLDCLSSGELNIMTILYNLIFKSDRGSILIIDEPEISLNMEWQKRFTSLLLSVQKFNNMSNQIIVATHSPFVTSGYNTYFAKINKFTGE